MKIIDLPPNNNAIKQTADLLLESFGKPEAWPTIESALEEVRESVADGRISRVAVDGDQTTLGGIDLYPDVYQHIKTIQNLRRHPYEFYQKLGYVIVGVLPDANGLGKPDIFMAKKVSL